MDSFNCTDHENHDEDHEELTAFYSVPACSAASSILTQNISTDTEMINGWIVEDAYTVS